jgi:sporulation protein YlmC with PRC-barrel domain
MSLEAKKRSGSSILAIVLCLAACQSASQTSSPTSAPIVAASVTSTTAPATAVSPTPAQKPPPATANAGPTSMPPQSGAAGIQPAERRAELTRLSNLLHFQVQGLNQANLGQISDYVINTCETYIIYFVMAPAAELNVPAGQKLVIPFEAVTINSGVLDAQAKAIVLHLTPDRLMGAPTFPDALALLPNSWEQPVRDFWQRVVRVGKLSSVCNATSGQVHKIAYATQLIGAQLKDGNGNLLGVIQDGILEPESGKLGFYVVSLKDNPGLILLPLAKTNIPESALQPGVKIELVLLADNNRLPGAPRLANADQATDAGAQGAARGYWGQ